MIDKSKEVQHADAVVKIPDSGQLPTHAQLSGDLLVPPEDLYRRLVDKSVLENITLEEALGEMPPDVSGMLNEDALPASVMSQFDSGIFPPATEAELLLVKLENKNASRGECLRRMMAAGSLTLSDTKGYRTRTAYRLIRQMARIRGLLEGFDMLQSSLNIAPDENLIPLWSMPVPLIDTQFLTGNRGIRAVLNNVDSSGETITFNTARGLNTFSGSTTLPPPIPDRFYPRDLRENWSMRVQRKIPDGYEVKQDKPLILFCEAMTMLAEQLAVPRGAPEEPWAGEYGLAGLLNPYTARTAWPSRDELVLYEEELMLKVYDKACAVSQRATEIWLQQFFGLSRLEALDIVKTAIAVGAIIYNQGTDEMRTLEIKRLDSLEDTCDLANDPRAKIAAKRLKFRAQGLTQREDSEGLSVLRDAAIDGIRSAEEEKESILED